MRSNRQSFSRTFSNGEDLVGELADRRFYTESRIETLQGKLQEAEAIAVGKACVYATGSFGRLEASAHSDLDLFIVGKSDDSNHSLLKKLDEICIKADLIEVTRELGFPPFSGDGRYLVHHSVGRLVKALGTQEDDFENTFTARLLLLLESRPLLEKDVYREVTNDVIAAYWRDYEDHKTDFMPAFLANDILRLWRTFCVNYEERTRREPEEDKAKGKVKNYKLKHSRLLTCYSALLYLLAVFDLNRTVSPSDAITMIGMTPTDRLRWILDQPKLRDAHGTILNLLGKYELFLETTNVAEIELIALFKEKTTTAKHMR
jgi:hypothetical protein